MEQPLVPLPNLDRQHTLAMLSDFRSLATALNQAVPEWAAVLERLLSTPEPAPTAPPVEAAPPLRILDSRPNLLGADVAVVAQPGGTDAAVAAPPPPEPIDNETVDLGASVPVAAPTAIASNPAETQILPASPDCQDERALACVHRGEEYRRTRDLRRALECYTHAIRHSPQCLPALLGRGQIYRLVKKPERAIVDFNALLEIDPHHVETLLQRGNALVDQGRHDEAIEDYSAAIALAPQNATAYLNRAFAHARKRDNTAVLHDAERALQIDPSRAAAYLLRGVAHSNRNSHERAIADLNRAVELDPRHALAYHERGLAFARSGNYPQAILSYGKALVLKPGLHIARFNRGVAHRLHGNYDLAIAELTAFLERQPSVAEAYYHRGLAQRARGDLSAALEDFTQTLTRKPNHAEAAAARLETQQEWLERAAPSDAAEKAALPTPPVQGRPLKVTRTVSPPDASRRMFVHGIAGLAALAAIVLLVVVIGSVFSGAATGFQAPRTVAVQGTVLYRGKPIDGVRVTLHPQFDIGPVKFCPSGVSDAQGRFTLSTGARDDGAPPGEYVVTFCRPRTDNDDDVDTWRGRHNDPTRSRWRVVVKEDAGLEPLRID
jgi:tetratricopeptide (TPR) repeat protein